ncbi:MAG: energy transducer TonB [Muribaculaceae bacterium]|nr:energy transducer TonB [Muribaculaceae bacterium]
MKKLLLITMLAFAAATAVAADKPQFPGGKAELDQYIATHLIYPPQALANGIEGIVDVAFIVHTDGSIGTIKIVRMVDPDLETEAIRLVKGMPAWIPAEKNGKPVDADAKVEINFELP